MSNPYAYRIRRKTVTRFFLDGQGFAGLSHIATRLAKKELGVKIGNMVHAASGQDGEEGWSEYWSEEDRKRAIRDALASLFPVCSTCGECNSRPFGTDRIEKRLNVWCCRTARNEWIARRAAEIRVQLQEALA